MATRTSPHPADHEFWQLIAQAAFTNPFTKQREELDLQMVGGLEEFDRHKALAERVGQRIDRLEAAGKANLRAYTGAKRDLMRTVFLFEIYHRFFDALDELILEQSEAGETPRPVKFAPDALSFLARRGFSDAESVRYFALFFQIRRAYHLIARGLVGPSACMKEFRRHLWNNVFTHDIGWYERCLWNRMEDFSTLLLGETGTGKGTAAAAIGRSGFIPFNEKKGAFETSFTGNFVSLNLSQFPETLIESELFGHKKGAFTGAIEAHEGVFARCSPHGAIFLDEIGDVSAPAQIKLLQVLQERTFTPVGSREKLRFRGRVIAATNQPLDELRRKKLFRDDFFYRLCSDVISVPPLRLRLRESAAELDLLLEHVMHRLTGGPSPDLVAFVRDVLQQCVPDNYDWPGNVRELEQAVRRILLTRRYEAEPSGASDLSGPLISGLEAGTIEADDLLSGYCHLLYQRCGSFQEVARRANLDPRTVKKYLNRRGAGLRMDLKPGGTALLDQKTRLTKPRG
jgi:hypothetical protein